MQRRTSYSPNPTPDKAKRPHNGVKIDKQNILHLIKSLCGNISKVADALGCARCSIDLRCKQDPELKQALLDARERWIDDVEISVLQRGVDSQDTNLQKFILSTQARHRGWDDSSKADIASSLAHEAFQFVVNKSKNPAEYKDGYQSHKQCESTDILIKP